ncbi:MAG: hypothetical protein HZC40_09700 [Chloroflexi bacterium]|nr:hypothetical protein [Chloroflexota bacterium]
MNVHDYHHQLVALIDSIAAIVASDISFREVDENECYIKATLTFATGHSLHLAEYVVIQDNEVTRSKYRYQLLTPDKNALARWDNAPHHKSLATFPDHRHDARDQPHPSRAMSPAEAIAESLSTIESQLK